MKEDRTRAMIYTEILQSGPKGRTEKQLIVALFITGRALGPKLDELEANGLIAREPGGVWLASAVSARALRTKAIAERYANYPPEAGSPCWRCGRKPGATTHAADWLCEDCRPIGRDVPWRDMQRFARSRASEPSAPPPIATQAELFA